MCDLCFPVFSSTILPLKTRGSLVAQLVKESACNAGGPGSIPGSGRFPRERIGYPLQCSWTSLVAQLVKNPPAMREIWVRSLGLGRFPGEGNCYPLQYSGLENSMDCLFNPRDHKKSDTTEQLPLCRFAYLLLSHLRSSHLVPSIP